MPLQEHQKRVVAEQRELSERIAKLTAFICGPTWIEVERAERARLIRQLAAMESLDHILLERIGAFEQAS